MPHRTSSPWLAFMLGSVALGPAIAWGAISALISGIVPVDGSTSLLALAAEASPQKPLSSEETAGKVPRHATAKAGVRGAPTESEEEPPPKVRRYAERLIQQYDTNGDGKLQPSEWRAMAGKPEVADLNQDQEITAVELLRRVFDYGKHRRISLAYPIIGWSRSNHEKEKAGTGTEPGELADDKSPASAEQEESSAAAAAEHMAEAEAQRREGRFYVPAKRLPAGLPPWFLLRDADGDGQLTQAEFAPKASPSDLEEFAKYDLNGDGVITPKECMRALKAAKSAGRK